MKIAARACAFAVTGFALLYAPVAFAALTPATDNSYSVDVRHQSPFGVKMNYAGGLGTFTQWTNMEARGQAERSSTRTCASGETTNCTPAEWIRLLSDMQGKSLRQKLEIANTAMNAHAYVPTEQNWHRAMYWESPFQFLHVGGQCQDYAIAKYELLRAAGVPASELQMVVLHASAINKDHAVLVAYADGEALLLDNLRSRIVPTTEAGDYRPYYAINETGWFYANGGTAMPTHIAYGAR